MIQQSVQVVISAIWMLCASPIAEGLSPSAWYALGATVTFTQLIISIFFLPDTKYLRVKSSVDDTEAEVIETCTKRPALDFLNFKPRTWLFDMELWHHKPDWDHGWEVLAVWDPRGRFDQKLIETENPKSTSTTGCFMGGNPQWRHARYQHCYGHDLQQHSDQPAL